MEDRYSDSLVDNFTTADTYLQVSTKSREAHSRDTEPSSILMDSDVQILYNWGDIDSFQSSPMRFLFSTSTISGRRFRS